MSNYCAECERLARELEAERAVARVLAERLVLKQGLPIDAAVHSFRNLQLEELLKWARKRVADSMKGVGGDE